MVYLNEYFDCAPGDFVEVEITHSDEYDLWAEVKAS
jgi:ribosomal protein S12 methylthiotransferase